MRPMLKHCCSVLVDFCVYCICCTARVLLQVGAEGAVREAHGHMLGPDEAALIESDDSDKVRIVDGLRV